VFCQWLLAEFFVNTVCSCHPIYSWAGFRRDGFVNFHNSHTWVDDDPHATMASKRLDGYPRSYLTDRCSVSSFVCVNDLPVLLEHVPLHQRQHIWFMYDGAPTLFLRTVG
jgi:hypothetical protein